jgi:hypothetical protein
MRRSIAVGEATGGGRVPFVTVAPLKMVRLLTAANAMEARIIAARLGAEGIVWELRGAVDGPLAIGPVEVLVDVDGFETAKDLMLAADVESSFGPDGHEVRETSGRDVLWAALALAALALFAIARMTARV